MASIYANLIINGRITIEKVPDKLRKDVERIIEEYNIKFDN